MQQAAAEQLTPIDHFVEINGLRLHYVQWGGEARERTILLLHGGAANTHWWDAVAPQLTAHGRVIALDFRGHGRSQWERPPHYGPPAYVDDVRKFIEQIGSPVVLVGHSMGGAVAQWTASLYPHLIEALVIIDAPHGSPPLWRRLMWRWRRRARGGGRPELDSAAAIIGRFRLVPPQTYLSRGAIERLAIDCAEQLPNGKWAFRFDPETRAWRRMVGSSLSRPKLRRITAPTLILRGAESTLISPRAMRAMQRRIRGSIAGEIPRAFHHVPLDNPDETAARIAMLFETLAPRKN